MKRNLPLQLYLEKKINKASILVNIFKTFVFLSCALSIKSTNIVRYSLSQVRFMFILLYTHTLQLFLILHLNKNIDKKLKIDIDIS